MTRGTGSFFRVASTACRDWSIDDLGTLVPEPSSGHRLPYRFPSGGRYPGAFLRERVDGAVIPNRAMHAHILEWFVEEDGRADPVVARPRARHARYRGAID